MATGLKNIDGKNYYFDQQGHLRKGFYGVFNGQVLYFDKNTGQSADISKSNLKEGLTTQNSDFTEHNAVNSTRSENFDNLNDYLTAESWYRPKDILKNGQQWQASQESDFRPILMSWWPNKKTEVAYLNFMKNNGFITKENDFSTDEEIIFLNQAAQAVQVQIEREISRTSSTDWLRKLINDFVDSQPAWNQQSEDPGNDHLQGGALTYINSPLTPDANSNFRLLDRTPTNQTGKPAYTTDNSLGGFELLLANDVDNSNPVVQAEQLNWLHYLMNFGSITAQDPDADFDGIRVDAVDNVDADLLQIAADYFRQRYQVDKNDDIADKHLSILEDWSHNDPEYIAQTGSDQLTMDDYMHTQLIWSLTKDNDIRGKMDRFIDYYMVDRSLDDGSKDQIANYSFVRAHDNEVQTVIAQIISDLYPDSGSGLIPSPEQLEAAFKVYRQDMTAADKKYTQFNIPSTYAMLLTNKDTVPRVYYGDLYTDDGQYMAEKSPYFQAIDALLKARIKYVAGGQTMSVDKNGLLTSVRFGKNIERADQSDDQGSKTQGIGLIVGNNPSLKLSNADQVVLHMGIAHKNQAYRALLLTTQQGLLVFDGDQGAPIKFTNDDGDLIFDQKEIYGVQNPQVSGYLAAWVPLGAGDQQDARSSVSEKIYQDGKVFHSNPLLDSQLIYEGFSNFQAFANKPEEYTNAVIAKKVDQFKNWGVTSFQLAPQYRSSSDNSFLDSIIQNGYAFTDRYDLGFDKPTKYGDVQQLRAAIKALHADGIQAIADWVPDQIYNLPQSELVTVDRTDSYGRPLESSELQDTLYLAYSKGGGKYQSQYGGAFLDQLKELYPELFTKKQISTGLAIDPSQKITEWSAKYFNGSNIQGRGASFVLSDGNHQYFKVSSNDNDQFFLPRQLTNDISQTGFSQDEKGISFYSTSGYLVKNSFITDDQNNYYYFNNEGYMVTGPQTINNKNYFFLPNGIELQNVFLKNDQGDTYYYGPKGQRVANTYITDQVGNSYRFDADGKMIFGRLAQIDGHVQYFDMDGVQAKDAFITDQSGNLRYFESGNGNLAVDEFKQLESGSWVYFGSDGLAVKGLQTINGRQLYFDEQGKQVKDAFITDAYGHQFYFNGTTGDQVKNDFIYNSSAWYFADENGQLQKGFQTINGKVKYFDPLTGQMQRNKFIRRDDGNWFYFDDAGDAVKGLLKINDQLNFFRNDFTQVKNDFAIDQENQRLYFFNGTQGSLVTNDYFSEDKIHWYHTDENGQLQKGFQTIDGQIQYFDDDGVQAKDAYIFDPVSNKWYYFDRKLGNGKIVDKNF